MIKRIPLSILLSSGFEFTKENAAAVLINVQDMNDPEASAARMYLMAQSQERLIQLLPYGFDAAVAINDSEWCYNLYKIMQAKNITFTDLRYRMPKILFNLLEWNGDFK